MSEKLSRGCSSSSHNKSAATGGDVITTRISKSLSFYLRHGGKKKGLHLDQQGWASFQNLKTLPEFSKLSSDVIRELVHNCPKQRFAVKEEGGELFIRANQGHSLQEVELELEELSAENLPSVVVHGTYMRHWDAIKATGLNCMSRAHIHFAPGLPDSTGVISGMRRTCQLHIYVDAAAAIADGFKFYRSANNVILCPGDAAGYLPARFKYLVGRKALNHR